MSELNGNERIKLRGFSESDLNLPLYRIFPLWLFERALLDLGGSLVLVPPSCWEDPWEDLCSKIQMQFPDRTQAQLANYLEPVYVQCWSFEGESDALLRSYSSVDKGKVTNL